MESSVCIVGKSCLYVSHKSCASLFCWKVLCVLYGASISFAASMEMRQEWVRFFCCLCVPALSYYMMAFITGLRFISELSDHWIQVSVGSDIFLV